MLTIGLLDKLGILKHNDGEFYNGLGETKVGMLNKISENFYLLKGYAFKCICMNFRNLFKRVKKVNPKTKYKQLLSVLRLFCKNVAVILLFMSNSEPFIFKNI